MDPSSFALLSLEHVRPSSLHAVHGALESRLVDHARSCTSRLGWHKITVVGADVLADIDAPPFDALEERLRDTGPVSADTWLEQHFRKTDKFNFTSMAYKSFWMSTFLFMILDRRRVGHDDSKTNES